MTVWGVERNETNSTHLFFIIKLSIHFEDHYFIGLSQQQENNERYIYLWSDVVDGGCFITITLLLVEVWEYLMEILSLIFLVVVVVVSSS